MYAGSINLGSGEEVEKNKKAKETLESKMSGFDSIMESALRPVFGAFDSAVKESGLKINGRDIKRRALDNMKEYIN